MTVMLTSYELLYIVPATMTDDEVARVETAVKGLLEKQGATIESTSRLGKFRLTYAIKGVRHGHYVLVRMNAEGAAIAKIDAVLRISSDLLRHLILRADEAGGEKFDLVQFTEVNVDMKDESPRRRRDEKTDDRTAAIKSGVAALEDSKTENTAESAVKEISAEELDKKIDTALQENV